MIGKKIVVPGLQYPLRRNSIVLAISETCRYCKESIPFYQKLGAAAQGKLDVIAVLPQPATEAKTYLQDASIPIQQVFSASLDSIDVHATPTLLLVNPSGYVMGAWIGLLSDESQKRVLAMVSR